jgi:hypothetical protein
MMRAWARMFSSTSILATVRKWLGRGTPKMQEKAGNMSAKPERRHVVEIKVGGDTQLDMLTCLRQIVHAVQINEDFINIGTPTTTGQMHRRLHPDQTHEKYIDDLFRYMVEEKANGD